MSGKGEGKKRNRAAQSEQHGYREPKIEKATKPRHGLAEEEAEVNPERMRVLDRLRDLERRRQDREKAEQKKEELTEE